MHNPSRAVRLAVTLGHGLVGWAFCGAIIGIGRQFLSMPTTLVVHAIGAPLGFCLLSIFYFRKLAFMSPLWTATVFLGVVVGLDLFLVAPFFEKSSAMFGSVLGTWVSFASIFAVTCITGRLVRPRGASM